MPKPTKLYSTDPAWADITPLPLPDTPSPLASIAYTDEYAEATAYLRAVMAADEHSPRVLDLTAHVISLNPGHYTVWLYRFATISKLGVSLKEELQWLRDVSLRNLKNYQIWHHRMGVVDLVGQEGELDMQAEREFLAEMLERDAKNYHVWSYRQWMVKRFGLFEDADEMEWTGEMIEADVRNNSAWNHRYYLCFGGREGDVPKEVVEREIA
jgi:protein farnesyltransferase/geranylgeranyltransferase type-1 subunit alpha